jgi:hypothetical protein
MGNQIRAHRFLSGGGQVTDLTFKCVVCERTITEPNNDEIEVAEFYRDFPEYAGQNPEELLHCCSSCYVLIKNELGVEGGNTIQ